MDAFFYWCSSFGFLQRLYQRVGRRPDLCFLYSISAFIKKITKVLSYLTYIYQTEYLST
jgi:hypothetical protein